MVDKLCGALAEGGVILFTAGGIDGEITGRMRGHDFYYSSLAEEEYLRIMEARGCRCVLMERDQYRMSRFTRLVAMDFDTIFHMKAYALLKVK